MKVTDKIFDTPKSAEDKSSRFRDHLASALGIIVAVANAWINIDWSKFDWTPNQIMVLALSGIIAIGGVTSKVKKIN